MELRLFIALSVLVLAAAIPVIGAAICGATIAVQVALLALRPLGACLSVHPSPVPRDPATPWFSVHIATHCEPPRMVIATLRALLDQQWPTEGYEIIVMDNNTANPALWKPVERFCATHSDRIRFLHRTGVKGAKAGALNIALAHTDTRTTHIVTVDADYVVAPDFLGRAAVVLQRTGADYVQFPQSYMGTALVAPGVDAELEEYFRTNAASADDAEAVLLTGTLCVISRAALVAAGGWSGAATTEDAELGVRLCNAGFSGRFINQVVGKGLLPLSLCDLEKQRYRWCSGNVQTLMRHAAIVFGLAGSLTLAKRIAILSQLTAWVNLALVPSLLLMAWLLTGQDHTAPATLAGVAIVLSLCDIIIRVLARGWRDRLAPGIALRALACRIALAPQSAKATFDALTGCRLKFIVTDKTGSRTPAVSALSPCTLLIFIIGVLLLAIAQPPDPIVLTALTALMLPLPAAVLTGNSLRAYRDAVKAQTQEAMA